MTATITTDATLRAARRILFADLDRLTDMADYDNDGGVAVHTEAWTSVKRDLARRRVPIAESDLTSTDELQHATHLYVLYMLFDLSELEEDKKRATQYLTAYQKEMADVEPTVQGLATASSGESTQLVIG